jgi:hypothetical protein
VKTRFISLFFLIASCGAQKPAVSPQTENTHAIKMRHQILFSTGEEDYVFEGYMILSGQEALFVKAFAGPGIDLFTVARQGKRHHEELHIREIAARMDITKVGADIARVYLGGCDKKALKKATCSFYGEQLQEEMDDSQRLMTRFFPDAHGVGLHINYKEYKSRCGKPMPTRIELAWGEGKSKMVILQVACEPMANWSDDFFDKFPMKSLEVEQK